MIEKKLRLYNPKIVGRSLGVGRQISSRVNARNAGGCRHRHHPPAECYLKRELESMPTGRGVTHSWSERRFSASGSILCRLEAGAPTLMYLISASCWASGSSRPAYSDGKIDSIYLLAGAPFCCSTSRILSVDCASSFVGGSSIACPVLISSSVSNFPSDPALVNM